MQLQGLVTAWLHHLGNKRLEIDITITHFILTVVKMTRKVFQQKCHYQIFKKNNNILLGDVIKNEKIKSVFLFNTFFPILSVLTSDWSVLT